MTLVVVGMTEVDVKVRVLVDTVMVVGTVSVPVEPGRVVVSVTTYVLVKTWTAVKTGVDAVKDID